MRSKIQIIRAQILRKYPLFRGQLVVRGSTAKHTASSYVHKDNVAKTELGGLVTSYCLLFLILLKYVFVVY